VSASSGCRSRSEPGGRSSPSSRPRSTRRFTSQTATYISRSCGSRATCTGRRKTYSFPPSTECFFGTPRISSSTAQRSSSALAWSAVLAQPRVKAPGARTRTNPVCLKAATSVSPCPCRISPSVGRSTSGIANDGSGTRDRSTGVRVGRSGTRDRSTGVRVGTPRRK